MEEKDIVPQLLEQLQGLFKTAKGKDKRIEALLEKALAGEAAYPDADEFAARVGEALAAAFREGLSADTLPEGRLWWNIADRAVRPLLEEGYKEGADFAGAVQESLNKKANIGLKVQTSPADRDRIDGILNMATAAERYDLKAAELEDAAVNLVQHAVTDTLRRNVESHARAGLSPRIIRRAEGRACKWCRSLAGTYAYPDVPEDVYRRHENCRCTVEYDPANGSKKMQNVHSKKWTGPQKYDTVKLKYKNTAEASRFAVNGKAYGDEAITVDENYVQSQEYRMRFRGITGNDRTEDKIAEQCKRILMARSKTKKESLVLLNYDTGSIIGAVFDSEQDNQITYSEEIINRIEKAKEQGKKIIAIHNHPEGLPPTADDCASALHHDYTVGVVCGHNGSIYTYQPSPWHLSSNECDSIHDAISFQCSFGSEYDEIVDIWLEMMAEYNLKMERR